MYLFSWKVGKINTSLSDIFKKSLQFGINILLIYNKENKIRYIFPQLTGSYNKPFIFPSFFKRYNNRVFFYGAFRIKQLMQSLFFW